MNCCRSSIILTALYTLIILVSGCAGSAPHQPLPDYRFSVNEFEQLKMERPAFPSASSLLDADLFDRYHRFYQLEAGDRSHVVGWVPTSDGYMFLQGWQRNQPSPEPAGTILLLHGYLEHSGNLETIINHLAPTGLHIYAMDLPGHGLSSGERGWIRDFSVYGAALGQVIEALAEIHPAADAPLILLGHSTGASAILEYLQSTDQHPDKIILLAPLIRSTLWTLSHVGVQIAKPLPLSTVPSSSRAGTENQYYLDLADIDPLRIQHTSLDWVRALGRWDKKNQSYGSLSIPALILQGTADRVLDWRYNLAYLEKRLPNAEISIIQGGHHNLHQEKDPNLQYILQQIKASATYASASED